MKTYKVTVDDEGTIRWYNENGQQHREDGPAIEWADGTKSWWINGRRHREDGPAIEHAKNGDKEWYINGEPLSEQEFIKRTQSVVELTIQDIENLVGKRVKIVKNKD